MRQAHPALRPAEIAARLRYFMEKAKYLPRRAGKFADAVGVSESTVSLWLSDKAEPTHDNLARACSALGIDLEEFWAAPLIFVSEPEAEVR